MSIAMGTDMIEPAQASCFGSSCHTRLSGSCCDALRARPSSSCAFDRCRPGAVYADSCETDGDLVGRRRPHWPGHGCGADRGHYEYGSYGV